MCGEHLSSTQVTHQTNSQAQSRPPTKGENKITTSTKIAEDGI